jgi:glyoxylase-like metal-dependent hydrolase (beta-lactamase superfamily II)
MKKRGAILSTIVVAGMAVAGLAAAQKAAPTSPETGKIEHIKGNLYKIFDGCSCGNTTVYVAEKGVVLVDTKVANNGQFILDQVKSITDKPVIMVINTHSHPDHNGSNDQIKAAYPSIDVVAQENLKTRVQTALNAPPPAPGARAFGPPANAAQLPNITFGEKGSVLSGKDKIDLYYFGRGHTDNDAFVVFTSTRAMAIGDLMAWNMAPLIDPGTNGSAIALADTLEKAQKGIKDVDLVIEGHGNVNTWQGMVNMAAFDRAIVTESKKAYDAKQSPDDALAALQKNPKFAVYLTKALLPGLEYGSSPAARALMNINVAFQELAGEKVTTNFGGALPATDKHKGGMDPAGLAPPRPARLGPPAGGAPPPPAAAPKT